MNQETNFEIQKMISFIRQESLEKAREIQLKANEEFQIQKAKLVKQEATKLQDNLQKQRNQIETQSKVHYATCSNQYRIEVQLAMDSCLKRLKTACKERIVEKLGSNTDKYKEYLKFTLVEMLHVFKDEPSIVIQCRQQDLAIVEEVIVELEGKKRFSLLRESFLSDKSLGGLVGYSIDGKIKCNDTVETRLDIAIENLAPEIRIRLFDH